MRILQIIFLIAVAVFALIGIPLIVGLISFNAENAANIGYVAVGVIVLINIAFVARYLFRRKSNK